MWASPTSRFFCYFNLEMLWSVQVASSRFACLYLLACDSGVVFLFTSQRVSGFPLTSFLRAVTLCFEEVEYLVSSLEGSSR